VQIKPLKSFLYSCASGPCETILQFLGSRAVRPDRRSRAAGLGYALAAEILEQRVLLTTHVAVIGDYGLSGTPEAKVAALVHSQNPDAVLTVGDNNYPTGSAATIDANIGQYYHDFISPYVGSYGAGAATNRFFPTLGGADWGEAYPNPTGVQPYSNYFTGLPGNGRYYTFTEGPVQFFALDSDPNDPDGNSSTSPQATWLQGQLAASTALYKIVYFHQPPYSSSSTFDSPVMRWPFQAWGATAVISGDAHNYERLFEDNNFPYFVDGLGGEPEISPFDAIAAGSQARYNSNFGDMLVTASGTQINFQFIAIDGNVVDSYTINANVPVLQAPAAVSLNQNGTVTFSGANAISVTDTANAGNDNLTLTLSVGQGTLSLATTTGLTISGNGTSGSPLTVTGSLSSIDADLPSLVYTPAANYNGADSLNLTVLDTTDQGQGSPAQVAITVNPLPVLHAPAAVSVGQNGTFTFSGGNAISVTDSAGAGNDNLTLTLSVGQGTLSLGSTTGLTVSGNGTSGSPLTVSGSLSSINADLPSLVYTPVANYNGADSLNVTVFDTTDQAQGSPAQVAITVNPTNLPPVLHAPASVSLFENSSFAFSGPNPISVVDTAGTGNNNLKLTINGSQGSVILRTWFGFPISSGSTGTFSMSVSDSLSHLNADLATLVYTPSIGFSGSNSLRFSLLDTTDQMQGASVTVPITVIVPASQPTVTVKTPLTTSVPGEPVPLVIAVTDTNAAAQAASFNFTVSFGDGNSTSFGSKSPLIVNHVYTHTGTFTVSVTATDEFGHVSTAATTTINVVAVALEADPFSTGLTALFVGTTGNNTINFAAGGTNLIAVTINGVSQGTFSANGSLIVFGQGGKDVISKSSALTNPSYLLQSRNANNVETDLDTQALQWAGLTAAMKILDA
jgi:tartrate-resistant acid phosphatase type 5